MSLSEKFLILLLIASNMFLFAGPGSLMSVGFLRILYRLFLLLGVTGLLGSVVSHVGWIWWIVSGICLLMSVGTFLMYRNRKRIDAFQEHKKTLVLKKAINQPSSMEENRWEDEGGRYF